MPVAEALDRVLEILRTTELYSPQLGTKDEDPHTNDLVGGLMTVSTHKDASCINLPVFGLGCRPVVSNPVTQGSRIKNTVHIVGQTGLSFNEQPSADCAVKAAKSKCIMGDEV